MTFTLSNRKWAEIRSKGVRWTSIDIQRVKGREIPAWAMGAIEQLRYRTLEGFGAATD